MKALLGPPADVQEALPSADDEIASLRQAGEAFKAIAEALAPLTPESRRRVILATAALFGVKL